MGNRRCSCSALECFLGKETADARTELTPLPLPPAPATMQGWSLVSDGPAMSRMASPTRQDAYTHTDTMPSLFVAIRAGDLEGVKAALKEDPETALNTRYGGFLPLHAACHGRHIDALTYLLQAGAKVDAVDGLGQTPLHLVVGDAWHNGIEALLQHGASPDTVCDPPSTVKGLRIETPLHVAVRRGDLTSTVLLLQYHPDLAQKDSDLCSVLHLAVHSRSLAVTRHLLKEKQAVEMVTGSERRGNSVLHMALMAECDAASEATVHDIVHELVQAGADVNHINFRGETPLYLAAHHRLSRVVEALLGLGADPTVVTRDGQSLLHAACHQGCASCLGHLLNTGHVQELVTARDNEGYEPFHYALRSGSIDCCELLLTNGDHLTRLDKDGLTRCSVILRHLPSAMQLLTRLFDSHVRLSKLPRHDPDFCVTFDYSVIYLEKEGVQSSLISELSTSRLEALLKHPLLESYLYLKWRRIKPFFYCSVALYLVFLLLHTTFIVMTFGQQPWNWRRHVYAYTVFLALHLTMFLLILIPDLVIMFANFKKYLYQWETYSKITALASSAFVVFSCLPSFKVLGIPLAQYQIENNTSWQNSSQPAAAAAAAEEGPDAMVRVELVRYVAAISAFFSWVEFMMLLGRFPSLGSYVLMFTRVARSIVKFLAAFSSLIMGFAVSFLVLFHENASFSSLPLSLTKTLMMMVGEIDFATFTENLSLVGGLFLVAFLFLVCVLMANLLIGLAVNDLPDLQRQGKIRRLSKQASYLVAYERLMLVARMLRCFPRQLRVLMTRRCKIPKRVSVWPNKHNSSSSSSGVTRGDYYRVPSETLHEAILLGTEDSKIDFNTMEEENSIAVQFRSFKIKYDRDRRQLQRCISQLPDTTTTEAMLKERLDHIQQTLQNQLLQLSLQLRQQQQQQQHSLCSRCRQDPPQAQTVQGAQQTGSWSPEIPNNFLGNNIRDGTHTGHHSGSPVLHWSPHPGAVQTHPLPMAFNAGHLTSTTAVQTPQQFPPVNYEKQQ